MIDETTRLESRVRALEEEANDEKAVTRHVLEQSIRNGDNLLALRSEVASFRVDLHALTSRVDHIAGDVVQANATLNSHGRRLNTLTQDVREIRTRLDGMDAKLDDVLSQDVREIRTRLDGMDAKLDSMDAKLDGALAAIRALAPRDPLAQ